MIWKPLGFPCPKGIDQMEVRKVLQLTPELRGDIERLYPQLSGSQLDLDQFNVSLWHPANTFLIAFSDTGQAIGMALLHTYRKPKGKVGIVDDVVTDEAFRGQGVGTAIMEELVLRAKADGVVQLTLTSNPRRVAAHGLYAKAGFVEHETDVFVLDLRP